MLKITIIILSIILFFIVIAVAFANGLIRGLKIMSTRNLKTSKIEKDVIKKVFKDDPKVDPFFYSLYIKDEIEKQVEENKKTIIKNKKRKYVKRSKK